jgi:hypothetical protein
VPPTARISIRCGTAQPPGNRTLAVDPDEVLGLRCDLARLAGHRWQVGGQHRQLAVSAGGQRRLQALVKLGRGQPPVASRDPEDLDGPVPVLIRGAQLGPGPGAWAISSPGQLTSHGHIL